MNDNHIFNKFLNENNTERNVYLMATRHLPHIMKRFIKLIGHDFLCSILRSGCIFTERIFIYIHTRLLLVTNIDEM